MYNGAMNINWEEIKLVLFDLDGTLNETDDLYVQRLVDLLGFTRKMFPAWDLKAFVRKMIMALESPGNFVLGLPDVIGLDGMWDQAVKNFGTKRADKPRHFKPVDGVIEMIETASKKGK